MKKIKRNLLLYGYMYVNSCKCDEKLNISSRVCQLLNNEIAAAADDDDESALHNNIIIEKQ